MSSPRLPRIFHLALAVLVTWPLAADPRGALLGDPDADVWNHAWGPWWWWRCLSEGALPWHTTLLRWPEGGTLWFIDPLLAAFAAPLVPLLGPAAAFNAALLASVAFTSAGAARLAAALAGPEPLPLAASATSSVALAGGAWVLATLNNGVSEALHLGPLAWTLALAEEAVARPDRRRWLGVGAALGGCAAVSPYLGLAGGVAVAVRAGLALVNPQRGARGQRGPLTRHGALGALMALVITAPFLLLFSAQLDASDALVRRPEAMNAQLALVHAADPSQYLAPLDWGLRIHEHMAHTAYVGLVALSLAIAAGRGRGALWAVAGVAALLGLGPWLSWQGAWVELGGHRVPLPWRAVQGLAPWLALTHADRLATPALALVAGLAGIGAARVARRLPSPALAWLLPLLALSDGLALSGGLWPIRTSPAAPPAVYATLPGDPSAGLLDLPTDAGASMATSRYLYWQTQHGHPIPYAPDARASTASLIDDPFFRALAALSSRREDEAARLGLQPDPSAPPRPERLEDRGYRWIVLHPKLDPVAGANLETLLREALGEGVGSGDALVWDLSARR